MTAAHQPSLLAASGEPLSDDAVAALLATDEARFWRAVAEIAECGRRYGRLTEKLARITAQLADPARGTLQERHAATERRERWENETRVMERESWLLRQAIATSWHRLTVVERQAVRATPGWPAASTAPEMARTLWELAVAGEGVPGCPF